MPTIEGGGSMYGTCQCHTDIHVFNDDCVGWRDYPVDPAENIVMVVTNPPDGEGTAYRLTLPDGYSKVIDETGDSYAELAGLIDDVFPDGPTKLPYLTLGEFREATKHLPDEVPITAAGLDRPDWPMWLNVDADDVPSEWPADDGRSSIVLSLRDDFDTRQW